MTITALPINASGGSPAYNARQTRQAFSGLMMPGAAQVRTRSGFRPGGAPSVSVTSTTWTVGAFSCVIDAGVSAVQGPYFVASDANSTGSITAADATFARKDLLVVQVSDTDEDGSGARSAAVVYVAGTASASPSPPGTPARSLIIGVIDVPHVGAGSPAFTASAINWVAAGGIVPVGSQAEEDGLAKYPGLVVARTDITPRLRLWDAGGTPHNISTDDGTTGTWTPTPAGFSPALPGTWTGAWRRIGDEVHAQASITLTSSYAVASFPTDWSIGGLPVTASFFGTALAYQSWGNLAWPAAVDGSTIYVHTTSKTATAIASGQVVRVAATYLASGS